MIKTSEINAAKDLPRHNRMLWGGCRETLPSLTSEMQTTEKDIKGKTIRVTFGKSIRDENVYPCVIVIEKSSGEKRYLLIEDTEAKSRHNGERWNR